MCQPLNGATIPFHSRITIRPPSSLSLDNRNEITANNSRTSAQFGSTSLYRPRNKQQDTRPPPTRHWHVRSAKPSMGASQPAGRGRERGFGFSIGRSRRHSDIDRPCLPLPRPAVMKGDHTRPTSRQLVGCWMVLLHSCPNCCPVFFRQTEPGQ